MISLRMSRSVFVLKMMHVNFMVDNHFQILIFRCIQKVGCISEFSYLLKLKNQIFEVQIQKMY